VLRRAWQWTVEQLAFLAVLAVLAAAFVYLLVEPGHWRRGSGVVATATLLAAVLRAVLPPRRAGLLAVRARWIDVVVYALMGGVILGAAIRLHS
jgi:Flp pilus assembly protein TadB